MFKKVTLENGLRIITIPMAGVTTATILVMVDTGSNNETKEVNGISHFLEHMFFKGTQKRPIAKMIAEEVDNMGGYTNAFTSREHTGYYLKIPAHKINQALDLISDIFSNSLLDQQEAEKERGVILQEIKMISDDTARHIGEVFESLLYGDQPAGWEIAGNEETLGNIHAQNLQAYFASQYTVDNTFVVVAGNVNEEEVRGKVLKAFGDVRRGETRGRSEVLQDQKNPAVSVLYKKTDQTHFILGNRAFGVQDERRTPAWVLAHILGGSMASRLLEELREKHGLAYHVQTSFDGYTNYGSFSTYAGVEHGNFTRALLIIMNEYKKIREEKTSEQELSRAKESLKGHLALSLESSNAMAFYIGGEEVLTGRPMTPEEVFAKIGSVSAEDILVVSRQLLLKSSLNLAVIGPVEGKEEFAKLLESF